MRTWPIVALGLMALACSPTPASVTVGAAGGTVSAGDVTLTVPPGALSTDVHISITATSRTVPGYTLLSPVYDFEPSGIRFARPVTVTIGFRGDPASAHLYWSSASGSGFDELASTYSAGALTATTTHFSDGFVGAPDTDADTGLDGALSFDAGAMDTGTASAMDAGPAVSMVTCTYVRQASGAPECATCTIPPDLTITADAVPIRVMAGTTGAGSVIHYCFPDGEPGYILSGRTLTIDAPTIFGTQLTPGSGPFVLECPVPNEQFHDEGVGWDGLNSNWATTISVTDGVANIAYHADSRPLTPAPCPVTHGCYSVTLDCTGTATVTGP